MKKWLILLLALLLVGCQNKKACNVNEGMICFDEETEQFILEDEAHLVVAVDSEAYGMALQELWDTHYPEAQGAIEYVVQESFDAKSYMNIYPDLGLLYSSEAARLNEWFYPIDTQVQAKIENGLVMQYGEECNQNGFIYVPMFGYGWVFSYNATLLEEAGVNLTDENQDGCPDAIDSFEKIHAWASSVDELTFRDQSVENVFKWDFNDSYQNMMLLSLANFKTFSTYQAELPLWDSEEFKLALNDLSEFGKLKWSFGEFENELVEDVELQQYSSSGSEFYLSDAQSVFSLVGTWMYYNEYEALNEVDFGFSAMPTFNGATMHPYTLSTGYVINKNTQYPNACFELIKLIRSDEGLQAYASVSENPLLYNYNEERKELVEDENGKWIEVSKAPLQLEFINENMQQISYAMMQGKEPSMVSFELDPSVRGWQMIEDCEIYSILKQVFDQTLSSDKAQEIIVSKTNEWLLPYLPPVEETN